MGANIEELKVQLEQLSANDRAEIAYFLLDSLGVEEEDSAEAWDAELARRVSDIHTGQAMGRAADDVLADMKKRGT